MNDLTTPTTVPGLPAWAYVLLYLGGFAVVCWIVYYQTRVTIPHLVRDFREEMKQAREAFSTELRLEREAHQAEHRELLDEIKALRESHRGADRPSFGEGRR